MADDSGTILTIHLLGGFCISAGEAAAAGLDHARVQRLLAYLLLHRRAPRSRQQIAFTLWPDTPDAQALTNLRTLLTRLRQAAAGRAQVVLISGEAGIGKTRLAEELLAWVQRHGIVSAMA